MKRRTIRAVFGWALVVALPAMPDAALSAPTGAQGLQGFLAMQGDRVLAEEHSDRLFIPASVHKLVVAAAALHYLGPEHRITTTIRARGDLGSTTLDGDLILEAAADPTWSERFHDNPQAPVTALARQLAGRGLRRVTGDLILDLRRFPGRPFPTSRPPSEYAYGYAAPTSALAVDENKVQVKIAPGPKIGAPGSAHLLDSAVAESVRLINHMRTVSRQRHGVGTVDFLPIWDDDAIVIRGEYPISEPPYVIDLSVPFPELHAGRALRRALIEEGIVLEGQLRLERQNPIERLASPLASHRSPPLAQRLEPILTDSHNWHAEMLLLTLAAEKAAEVAGSAEDQGAATDDGWGRLDEGLKVEQRFLKDEVGCRPGDFYLDDGSGLSPYNLLTPRCVVALLHYAQDQPWRAAFVAALANTGQGNSARGTLKAWPRLPPLAAKTGSLRHTLALAGYLDPESPRPILFAVFLNHRPGERAPQRADIVRRLHRWRGR